MNALFVFEEAAQGGGWGQFILIGVMIVAMVVMFIFTSRSNKKKEKEEKERKEALVRHVEQIPSSMFFK